MHKIKIFFLLMTQGLEKVECTEGSYLFKLRPGQPGHGKELDRVRPSDASIAICSRIQDQSTHSDIRITTAR